MRMHRNLVSYSDGVNSTGRLLFYLTALDATAQDLEVLQYDAASQRGSAGLGPDINAACWRRWIPGQP